MFWKVFIINGQRENYINAQKTHFFKSFKNGDDMFSRFLKQAFIPLIIPSV